MRPFALTMYHPFDISPWFRPIDQPAPTSSNQLSIPAVQQGFLSVWTLSPGPCPGPGSHMHRGACGCDANLFDVDMLTPKTLLRYTKVTISIARQVQRIGHSQFQLGVGIFFCPLWSIFSTKPPKHQQAPGVYYPRHFVVVLYLAGELLVAIVGNYGAASPGWTGSSPFGEHGEFAMMKRPILQGSVGVWDVWVIWGPEFVQ